MFWYLGETRYIYAVVTSTAAVTISSATCSVYLLSEGASEDTITSKSSGNAVISGNISTSVTLGYLFTPDILGNYLAIFSYVIGSETYESRQIINVRETI